MHLRPPENVDKLSKEERWSLFKERVMIQIIGGVVQISLLVSVLWFACWISS